MMPAVNIARNGFEVTNDTVQYLTGTSNPEFLTEDPAWAIDFAPNGTLVQLGQTMTRKRYANTLECIADEGAAYVKHGQYSTDTGARAAGYSGRPGGQAIIQEEHCPRIAWSSALVRCLSFHAL